jgi:hypothetical protein
MAEFEMRWTKKIFGNPPLENPTELTEAPETVGDTPSVSSVSSISGGFVEKNCTCPKSTGPAGVGRGYSPCPVCAYTWRCKDCGGCRQCGLPARKVKTEERDLPFPLGFGGLDSAEVARAERINLALGVVDPLKGKLSVINWLYQHYRDLGNHEVADQLKQAYWQLREPDLPLLALTRMGELDEATLLRRLVNGQKWLGEHLHSIDGGAADAEFSKALAGWTRMEADLRQDHGYQGCIHGEGGRCPDDAAVSCDVCVAGLH